VLKNRPKDWKSYPTTDKETVSEVIGKGEGREEMKKNIGSVDRIIRVILGLGLVWLAVYWKCWICAVVAAGLLLTAAIGWCGLYQLLGISTCKIKK